MSIRKEAWSRGTKPHANKQTGTLDGSFTKIVLCIRSTLLAHWRLKTDRAEILLCTCLHNIKSGCLWQLESANVFVIKSWFLQFWASFSSFSPSFRDGCLKWWKLAFLLLFFLKAYSRWHSATQFVLFQQIFNRYVVDNTIYLMEEGELWCWVELLQIVRNTKDFDKSNFSFIGWLELRKLSPWSVQFISIDDCW